MKKAANPSGSATSHFKLKSLEFEWLEGQAWRSSVHITGIW